MADQQILVSGQASAPLAYTVPNAIEAALLCVNATIDGTGASGAYLPTVEIVSDGGVVVARCPCFTTLAAGASAEVSWFRLRNSTTSTDALSPYQQTITSTADLRSYWPLDETAGTTFADLGPSNLPLSIVGAVALGRTPLITTGHSAAFSGGFNFPTADQYAIAASGYGPIGNDGSCSVECWINTTFSPAGSPEILSMDDNHFRLFQFRMSTTGKLEWITFDSGDAASTDLIGATTINTGTRRYLAATLDGTSLAMKVYVDGVLDGSSLAPSARWTGDTPQPTLAARWVAPFAQTPIGGTIDEVAFYSRALTQAEITAHFAAGQA